MCANYSEIFSTRLILDKNKGYGRQHFSYSEHLRRAKNKCQQLCFQRQYEIEFESWLFGAKKNNFVSLQIAFEDFIVRHSEEYPSCDITCIVGEVGGN